MANSVIFDENQEALFNKAAEFIISRLSKVQTRDPVLGLCGGRSVVGLLKALGAQGKSAGSLMKRIQFFMVDERIVPLDHVDSNFKLLKSELFDGFIRDGTINDSQVHPFDGVSSSASVVSDEYLNELSEYGGVFDLIVLGMGEDGHVAGVFPNHPTLEEKGKRFIVYHGSPKPPQDRMTASVPLLTSSGSAVLLAIGDGKKEAFTRYMNKGIALKDCPSKLVDQIADSVMVTNLSLP